MTYIFSSEMLMSGFVHQCRYIVLSLFLGSKLNVTVLSVWLNQHINLHCNRGVLEGKRANVLQLEWYFWCVSDIKTGWLLNGIDNKGVLWCHSKPIVVYWKLVLWVTCLWLALTFKVKKIGRLHKSCLLQCLLKIHLQLVELSMIYLWLVLTK